MARTLTSPLTMVYNGTDHSNTLMYESLPLLSLSSLWSITLGPVTAIGMEEEVWVEASTINVLRVHMPNILTGTTTIQYSIQRPFDQIREDPWWTGPYA
jgi:hypothetical protein